MFPLSWFTPSPLTFVRGFALFDSSIKPLESPEAEFKRQIISNKNTTQPAARVHTLDSFPVLSIAQVLLCPPRYPLQFQCKRIFLLYRSSTPVPDKWKTPKRQAMQWYEGFPYLP
jgi:hypothetical protein